MEKRLRSNRSLLEWVDSLVFAAVLLALVFTFGARIVQVDGSSMNPGLVDGERLLLSSLPYEPEYGDVVVIDSYTDYGKLLIKRVIGKEGDVIDIDFDSGIVYRNGQPDPVRFPRRRERGGGGGGAAGGRPGAGHRPGG